MHLNQAYTLDPAGKQWTPGGPLDQSLAWVNAGTAELGADDERDVRADHVGGRRPSSGPTIFTFRSFASLAPSAW